MAGNTDHACIALNKEPRSYFLKHHNARYGIWRPGAVDLKELSYLRPLTPKTIAKNVQGVFLESASPQTLNFEITYTNRTAASKLTIRLTKWEDELDFNLNAVFEGRGVLLCASPGLINYLSTDMQTSNAVYYKTRAKR